jgi:hypothetical protein
VSWTQRTPAGLPWGMPGMGEEIDRAMQQAPQPGRQSMRVIVLECGMKVKLGGPLVAIG